MIWLLLVCLAFAEGGVPTAFEDWASWFISQHPERNCITKEEELYCNWMGRADIDIQSDGAHFVLKGRTDQRMAVQLVGGEGAWPINVKDNGLHIPVLEKEGRPVAYLEAGEHRIEGDISWLGVPERLQLPSSVAIVELRIEGKSTKLASLRPEEGIFLGSETDKESRLSIQVSRLVKDGVPMELYTVLSIRASGASKELVLGQVVPRGSELQSFESSLPLWRNEKGEFVLQSSSGDHSISIHSIMPRPVKEMRAPKLPPPWPEEEFWAFQSEESTRLVEVQGGRSIASSRTPLPAPWKELPAYLLRGGETLEFIELRRGNAIPASNRLSLHREIWLDMDGESLSIQDHFSGQMNQGWRLDAHPNLELGQVLVDGNPQVLTRSQLGVGVELRDSTLSMSADSRWPRLQSLNRIGWQTTVESLDATLHLPPGWKLLHATGADQISGSLVAGISSWRLLSLSFLLLTIFAWKGRWTAALATPVLIVGATEAWLIPELWIVLIGMQQLSDNWSEKSRWGGRTGTVVKVLILMQLALFAHSQLDKAFFPSAPLPRAAEAAQESLEDAKPIEYRTQDPSYLVQTGPGIPSWLGESVSLDWWGPQTDESVDLYLLSPEQTTSLCLIRLVLLSLLGIKLFKLQLPRGGRSQAIAAVALCLLPLGAEAEVPDTELRKELEKSLLKGAQCGERCINTPLMSITAEKGHLVIRAEVHAGADGQWAVPGPLGSWSPENILVDGMPFADMRRDGDQFLYLRLQSGVWEIEAKGELHAPLQLEMVEPAQQLEFYSEEWQIEGLREDKTHSSVLSIQRLEEEDGPTQQRAHYRLTRILDLGIPWTVRNLLVRQGENPAPTALRIPKLEGEAVLEGDVSVDEGAVLVSMGQGQLSAEWGSELEERQEILLQAPLTTQWTEEWQLECGEMLSCQPSGIAPILHAQEGKWRPLWRPWPEERLKLSIKKPAPKPQTDSDSTVTIESAKYSIQEHGTSSLSTLVIGVRASRSGILRLALPENSEPLGLIADGIQLPTSLGERGELELNYRPGSQSIRLRWRAESPLSTMTESPTVRLDREAANLLLEWAPPPGHWVLWASGTDWGAKSRLLQALFYIVVASLFLARLPLSRLTFGDWVLLGLGLSQIELPASLLLVAWLLWTGWLQRSSHSDRHRRLYWLSWVPVVALLGHLVSAALTNPPAVGLPEHLAWYADRSVGELPKAHLIVLPMWTWKALTLAWLSWLVLRARHWLK
jgi:hypothetical protein